VEGGGFNGNIPFISAFKTNKNGVLLHSKFLLEDINGNGFDDGATTYNNRILLVGNFGLYSFNTYLYKLKSDLEFDSIYSTPFVYDSLCPYPIVSDTLPLDCVIVGLDEIMKDKEKSELKVYPNPASDIMHIVIPGMIRIDQSTQNYTAGTFFHQWKSADIEIYDLSGTRVYQKEVHQTDPELSVDISYWPPGMYVVRLVYLGRTAGSGKVVVE